MIGRNILAREHSDDLSLPDELPPLDRQTKSLWQPTQFRFDGLQLLKVFFACFRGLEREDD